MKEFLQRLSSRKFLVTIAGIIGVTVYPQYAEHIVQLIVAYGLVEGAGDVVQRYSSAKYIEAPIAKVKAADEFFHAEDDDDVDKDQEPVAGQ